MSTTTSTTTTEGYSDIYSDISHFDRITLLPKTNDIIGSDYRIRYKPATDTVVDRFSLFQIPQSVVLSFRPTSSLECRYPTGSFHMGGLCTRADIPDETRERELLTGPTLTLSRMDVRS